MRNEDNGKEQRSTTEKRNGEEEERREKFKNVLDIDIDMKSVL